MALDKEVEKGLEKAEAVTEAVTESFIKRGKMFKTWGIVVGCVVLAGILIYFFGC